MTCSKSTFCVNSLAHWLGETPFDDKHSPRDHVITALVTIGEGYHNFHHQFPMDYRNAIKWYQYDPTKWFIWTCKQIGLASQLKKFPDNEVKKGVLTMQLKKLRETQDNLAWPSDHNDLPVVSWDTCTLPEFVSFPYLNPCFPQSRNNARNDPLSLCLASFTMSQISWTSIPADDTYSSR